MMYKTLLVCVLSAVFISACGGGGSNGTTVEGVSRQAQMQSLGKKLFFDESLSSSQNQSCASCHDPVRGFADPNVSDLAPVSMGSEDGFFGARNAPTAAYASFSPIFSKTEINTTVDGTTSIYQGGQFLDGRRDNLMQQAKDPFLNTLEMNNLNAADVVVKVSKSEYAKDFIALFGSGVFDNIDTAYTNIAMAIAMFEQSDEVNRFSAKFDDVMRGEAQFTSAEQRGFNLFKGSKAKCANCHSVPEKGTVLFTNFRYYNVGTPVNTFNPAVLADSGFIDTGLSENEFVINAGDALSEAGKFKTPTLRNIELTAPYMHNGVFQTLDEVIAHYDFKMQFGIIPEVDNAIANEVAFDNDTSLGLSTNEIADLISFLKTLTDK